MTSTRCMNDIYLWCRFHLARYTQPERTRALSPLKREQLIFIQVIIAAP
jgi:hypothetical protein